MCREPTGRGGGAVFSSYGMGFALKRRRIKGDPASLQQ
jgi:hypothetical protein